LIYIKSEKFSIAKIHQNILSNVIKYKIKLIGAAFVLKDLNKTLSTFEKKMKQNYLFKINHNWQKFICQAQLIIYLCLFSGLLLAEEINCTICHTKTVQDHQSTPHAKANVSCDSCHGDGKLHISAPSTENIPGFTKQPAKDQSGVCVDCHKSTHSSKLTSHNNRGITCGSCHIVHSKEQQKTKQEQLPIEYKQLDPGTSLCFDCHQDSFTQFELNESHRLTEGVVTCSSCHDPHNPQEGLKLGGFKPSVCSDCHADVVGPFIFEHAASRVEGCASCHEPHGSANRHMLKIQEVGALCYSCHADAPQFHVGFSPSAPPRFDESTVCTNCHVTIHGSNLDSNFLR
jgi:DmsE family decaheme c-type cytochrome